MKIGSLVVASCLLALALPAVAQPPSDAAAQEAYMKAATPGENHKILGNYVGDWTFTNKMWMAPGQPPVESGGTIHAEWILGGRYVQSVYKGNMMGMPFEGHGTDGYDNVAGKYVSSWVDNMGTGIMTSSGTCDANKVCTQSGDMLDPATGQKVTMRSVISWVSDTSFKLEMYVKDASGNEMKMMEMVGTKK
jgi:hypothetical protein